MAYGLLKMITEAAMNSSDARLFAMLLGWTMAWYGVRRRDWPGTVTALAGLGLATGAMAVGEIGHAT
jgi:hypothetical protein